MYIGEWRGEPCGLFEILSACNLHLTFYMEFLRWHQKKSCKDGQQWLSWDAQTKKEAVARRCSVISIEISQNSQENTYVRVSFNKVAGLTPATLLKKETLT